MDHGEWIGDTEPNKTLRVSGNGDEIDHVCNFLLDNIRTQRPTTILGEKIQQIQVPQLMAFAFWHVRSS
jgi:hypothetical protein